mgnify:FL=1
MAQGPERKRDSYEVQIAELDAALSAFKETESDKELREWVRGLGEQEFFKKGIEDASLDPGAFPREFLQEVAKVGLTGLEISEEYGGTPMTNLEQAIVMEELARIHAGLALSILVLNSLTAYEINRFGTEAQKEKYLRAMAEGRLFAAFALTEPDAGTDAKNIQLKAIYDEERNGFVLNGRKRFITGANGADVFVVATRTGAPDSGEDGITAFLVDSDLEGISIEKVEPKAGQPGSPLCEILFQDTFVPADAILGKLNEGWYGVFDPTLKHSRNWIAAQGVGLEQRAQDLALGYSYERKAFGGYLKDIPVHSATVDTLRIQAGIARALTRIAAQAEDSGDSRFFALSSLSKLIACDTAAMNPLEAMQLHGGIGYSLEMEIAKVWLASPVLRIYEGTVPVQVSIAKKGGIKKETMRLLTPPKLSETYLVDDIREIIHPGAIAFALREYELAGQAEK